VAAIFGAMSVSMTFYKFLKKCVAQCWNVNKWDGIWFPLPPPPPPPSLPPPSLPPSLPTYLPTYVWQRNFLLECTAHHLLCHQWILYLRSEGMLFFPDSHVFIWVPSFSKYICIIIYQVLPLHIVAWLAILLLKFVMQVFFYFLNEFMTISLHYRWIP
jgi:hypothetical protein